MNIVANRIAPNIRKTPEGRMDKMVSSKSRVKSKVRAQPATEGPKTSSTAEGQLIADELLAALVAMVAIDPVASSSSVKHISCRT